MTFGLRCSQPACRPHPASLPVSCSYGRRFATRFFQLHLAATPCVSLRLSSSTPSSSFHLDRFCPCWAHWGRLEPAAGFSPQKTEIFRPSGPLCSVPVSQRHLPHLYVMDQPLFLTFRLHGSLPPGRGFPTESM